MKNLKKVLAFLMSAILVLTYLPVASFAADDEPIDWEALAKSLVWESRAFGQSTDLNFTSTVDTENHPELVGMNEARVTPASAFGTIGEGVTVEMESRGGKITGGHDGIVYYYTVLDPNTTNFELAADITVIQYGKVGTNDSPQQCGFGIMARDTVGPARQDPFDPAFQEIPAASNMFYIGANAGSRTSNRTGVTYRRGVVDPGNLIGCATSGGTLSNTQTMTTGGSAVRIAIGRDDKGFYARTGTAGGTLSAKSYTANATVNFLQQQDPNHMYIGFFASRNAQVKFENIELTLSAYTAPDPLPTLWTPTNSAVKRTLYMRSGTTSGTEDYDLTLYGNDTGKVTITKGNETVAVVDIKDEVPLTVPLKLTEGNNSYKATYTEYSDKFPASTTSVSFSINYTAKEKPDLLLYASPNGSSSAAGTKEDPMNVSTAMNRIDQGGTVILLEGTYSGGLSLGTGIAGTQGKLKTLRADEGARVHFENGALSCGTYYWHLYGLEFSGRSSSCNGSFNIVENCEFRNGNETGLSLGNGSGNGFPFGWPSYNLIKNCTSHDNYDSPAGMNADGFAPKLGVGPGNVFDGCIAYGNIDDGYDLYNKVEKGANAPITLRNCIAYGNGIWVNPNDPTDIRYGGGGGNGFKVGGEGIPVAHVVTGCIAFNNFLAGFSDNFNPGYLVVNHNTAFNNTQQNFIFRDNPAITPSGTYRDMVSFRTDNSTWVDAITGDTDATVFMYAGKDKGSDNGKLKITADDFVSVTPPAKYERDEEGNIIYGDFLRPTCDSILATAGTDGGYVGALAPAEHKAADPVQENIKAATCTKTGSYDEVVYCSECKAEISRTAKTIPVDKNAHTPARAVQENVIDPTCVKGGSYDEVVYCSECKAELSRTKKTTEPTGKHTAGTPVKENVVERTCSTSGSYDSVTYCTVCEKELSRTPRITEPGGDKHNPGEAVVENEVPATCLEDGSYDEVIYCADCQKELSRESKALTDGDHADLNGDGLCDYCQTELDVDPTGDNSLVIWGCALLASAALAFCVIATKKREEA